MAQYLSRMRVKRHHDALATNLLGPVHHVSQYLLMSTMHPVERPDGDYRMRYLLKIIYVVINFHFIQYGQGMPCPYNTFLIK